MSIARPGDEPSPTGAVNSSMDGLLDPTGGPSASVAMVPRHSLRAPNGKMIKQGYGGYNAVDRTWCHDRRDLSVLHSPVPRPAPSAADWSQGRSYAQSIHDAQCRPGSCAYPALHQGIEDGYR
jgi:hypothetical protein